MKEGQRVDILHAGAERGACGCAMPRTWQLSGGIVPGKRSAACGCSVGCRRRALPPPPRFSLRMNRSRWGGGEDLREKGQPIPSVAAPRHNRSPLRRPSPSRPRPASDQPALPPPRLPGHPPCGQVIRPFRWAPTRSGRNGSRRSSPQGPGAVGRPRGEGYGLATAPVGRPSDPGSILSL